LESLAQGSPESFIFEVEKEPSAMIHTGSCQCKRWSIAIETAKPLQSFNPRVCDCGYCAAHPAALVSDPSMITRVSGNSAELVVNSNGDQLAGFYHCAQCGDMLAVGCMIDGQLRGAANAMLLEEKPLLGPSVAIQPRLLPAQEKLKRWGTLWGRLEGV
jgi:hypothetical protein